MQSPALMRGGYPPMGGGASPTSLLDSYTAAAAMMNPAVAQQAMAAATFLAHNAAAVAAAQHHHHQHGVSPLRQQHGGGRNNNPYAMPIAVGGSPLMMTGGYPSIGGGGASVQGLGGMGGAYHPNPHSITVGNISLPLLQTTPLRGANNGSTNVPSGLTTPVRQKTQPQTERAGRHSSGQQQRDPALAKEIDTSAATPIVTNRRLERDLSEATKEELLQILLELSYFSPDAAKFIDCKSQIFALRPRSIARAEEEPIGSAHLDASTTSVEGKTATAAEESATGGASSSSAPCAHTSSTPQQHTPAPSAAALHAEAPDTTPETRDFVYEQHPCIAIYRSCRFPSTCVFANTPRNLCVAYARGGGVCPNGNDCSFVHRLPDDASDALKQLFFVQQQRNREAAAQQAAATAAASAASPSRRVFESTPRK